MKSIDLGSQKVWRIFVRFAIPSILVMVTQTVAYIVDSIFVGQFVGPNGLSAITLFLPLVSFFIGIATMIAIGSNNMAGISLGKGNVYESNKYFNIAIRSIVVISLSLSTLALFCMSNLTNLLNVEGETRSYVIQYGTTISSFFIVYMLNLLLSYFIKLEGRPEYLIKVAIISAISNVVFDYFFIVYLKWSLLGAALATGLSQVVMFGFILHHFITASSWSLKKIPFQFESFYKICHNGFSQFLTETSMSITGFILNMMILKYYGLLGIAAYAVASQFRSLAAGIANGISEAARVGISYNFGAREFKRVKAFRRLASVSSILVGVIFCIVAFMFGEQVASLFVKDVKAIEMASYILKYIAITLLVFGFNISVRTYFAAVNAPTVANYYTLYRSIVSIVIALVIFPLIFGGVGVWYALIFKEVSSALMGACLYIKEKDQQNVNEKDVA